MSALAYVIAKLEAFDCRPRGSVERGYIALCPAHEDNTPSLSVGYRNTRVLLHCHAGCATEAVLDAMALDWRSLFDDDTSHASSRRAI